MNPFNFIQISWVLYFVFALAYVVSAALWRFWYSKTGTFLRPGRSILLRSPSVFWAFFGLNLLGVLLHFLDPVSPSWYFAFPLMSFYYSLRFGSLKLISFCFYILGCLYGIFCSGINRTDILSVSGVALGIAFSADLLWNWILKRNGILVPGTAEELVFDETVG